MSHSTKLRPSVSQEGMMDSTKEARRVMGERQQRGTAMTIPARGRWVSDWPRWAPYAAVAWSLVYAALGVYWAMGGSGFPYAPELTSNVTGAVAGRFGTGVAWIIIIAAGLPAAAVGTAMLRR